MDDKAVTVTRWLAKAEGDLYTARTMLATEQPQHDVVCFHSQQCAEKALKAFLVNAGKDFPKTHHLTFLLDLCKEIDPDLSLLEEDALQLSDYAVETRYVEEWRDIPPDEASQAIAKAENIVSFVKSKLNYQ